MVVPGRPHTPIARLGVNRDLYEVMVDPDRTLGEAGAASASGQASAPFAYHVARALVLTALRVLFRFEVTGRGNLPRGAYIAVANHLNWLDAFALVLALRAEPQVHFIGWDGILNSPKLAWLIRVSKAGFIPVVRDPARRSIEGQRLRPGLRHCLRDGNVLALFPEGQVGCVEGEVMPFMPGFAHVSLMAGAPVVPIALSGTRNLWWRKRIRVVIGRPISPFGTQVDALVDRTRSAVIELMPKYADPGGHKLFERKLTRLIPSLTNWTSDDL